MSKKKRIALDMDEVIADVRPKFLDLYEREFGRRLRREDYWGKKIYEVGNGARRIRDSLFEKGFFADLPVMPGSAEVVRWLWNHYDIYITTAAMEFRSSLEDKYDWLRRHFPFIHWKNIVFCGDKSVISADYMIDDHPHNLRNFSGKGLLYTASHNIQETAFTRVNDWNEVREFFEREMAAEL
jgi:5'-nucleotidase